VTAADYDDGSAQAALFEPEEYDDWRPLWRDMPAYSSADETPYDNINVQFSNAADRRAFLTLLGEDPLRRKSIWYPSVGYLNMSDRKAGKTEVPAGRYPIYVISKGRADTRLTVKALDLLSLPYHLVIEPPEYDAYAEHVPPERILQLPFHDLGLGGIPARNWVWDHATEAGHARHWILDDNIDGFYRMHENRKWRVRDENPFVSIEDWVDRYRNVPMAGMQYQFFAPRREKTPPLRLNTRVYSCILLTNGAHVRPEDQHLLAWRGRYNEDTDLSLRFLKAGYVTALFNHMLCQKMPTMTMKGGNTEALYKLGVRDDGAAQDSAPEDGSTDPPPDAPPDGRLLMAQSLCEQHPDVARVSWKWGRWQHHVDYRPFAGNRLQEVQP